jgi:hypothetical protein
MGWSQRKKPDGMALFSSARNRESVSKFPENRESSIFPVISFDFTFKRRIIHQHNPLQEIPCYLKNSEFIRRQ